jgi:hypothetical protein
LFKQFDQNISNNKGIIVNKASAILNNEALLPNNFLCVNFSAKIVIEPPACSNEAQKNTVKTEKINTAIILSRTTFTGVFSAAAFSLTFV